MSPARFSVHVCLCGGNSVRVVSMSATSTGLRSHRQPVLFKTGYLIRTWDDNGRAYGLTVEPEYQGISGDAATLIARITNAARAKVKP